MFTSAQTFAKQLFDSQKEFFDRNTDLFEDEMRRLNMIASAKENSKIREKWLIENNKTKEFIRLQREINLLIGLAEKMSALLP